MILLSESNCLAEPYFNYGFKDNFITFQSDSLIVPLNASVVIDSVPIIIYPNPQGKFYFNFKEYISYALNRIQGEDPVTKVIYFNTPIQVNYINNTSETFLYPLYFVDGNIVFREALGLEFMSVPKIKLFLGNSNNFLLNTAYQSLLGSTTKFYKKDTPSNFFTATSLPGTIGVNLTYNPSIITGSGIYVAERSVFKAEIDIEIETCLADRFDIRFKNLRGGYSYWSFDYWQVQRQPKDLGEVSTNTNLMRQIGKSVKDIVTVESDVNYPELFAELLESNTIHFYERTPGGINNFPVEIALTAQSKTIKDFKNNKPFTLQFELPARYTRTL